MRIFSRWNLVLVVLANGFEMPINFTEEDWQVICEQSLFANRLHQLEDICLQVYNGNSVEFINNYLRPVVELLDTIRSKCEDYYELKSRQETPPWNERFENIVKYAIHPSALRNTTLHKGDFYVHISASKPRALELKYFHAGQSYSRPLSMTDNILMCSENWVELLKSDIHDRFVFSSCILWTNKGFEKTSWCNILIGHFPGTMEAKEQESTLLNHPDPTFTMEEFSVKPILILDLSFELLHNQVAYLPGSRDKRGAPVIFFETNKSYWENTDYNSEELMKLLMYYYKIPRESSQGLGCSLVIDARVTKQTREILQCIGEAILMFQEQIPGSVHMAHVLTRKDSLMLLLKASKIKDSLNFEFQFLSSVEKLMREISIDELPTCYGGNLSYDHEKWIKFRTKVEPFMTGCRSAAKHALKYIQEISRTDMGTTVEDCQRLLEAHERKVKEVLNDPRLQGLQTEGRSILERISFEEFDAYQLTDDYKYSIECLNNLYAQMSKVFDRLQVISDVRKRNLELCLKIRIFETNSLKVVAWIQEEGLPPMRKEVELGDSLEAAHKHLEHFKSITTKTESMLNLGEETIEMGGRLIDVDDVDIDVEAIRQTLEEVQTVYDDYSSKYTDRNKKLNKNVEFHTLVKAAENWWMSGLQFIAHMNMEDIQTCEGIARLKDSFVEFTQKNPAFEESKVVRMTELAHHLGHTQVTKAEQTNSRCVEVENMLQAKQNQILGAEKRLKMNRCSIMYSDNDETSSGFKEDDLSTEPDDDDDYTDTIDNEYVESVSSPLESSVVPMFSWKDTVQPYDANDPKLAVFDAAMSPKKKERLKHIINEMISTESDYVASLEYILEHYIPEMSEERVPPFMKGKKYILFGNIERIYDFHKRFFSQEVVTYRHAPLQIGKCFLKWERQFYLYALYNKNKPKSDQLWDDFANTHFQTKMKELKDKLDLASYLIKPVQRLGKYTLLLQDMITCCDQDDPRVIEMKKAHELMRFQLRHGNDLLAMDSIRNADVNLKDQGCLLRQADFIVSYNRRKRLRRMFLFEDLLVFTKPKKQKAKGDNFLYKHSVKMADLGLTENIGDSGTKFEVWYRRWKKRKSTETFILQATSESVKIDWTTEISKILWRQATRSKEYGQTEASTGISIESTPSSVFYEPHSHYPPTNHASNCIRSRSVDVSPTKGALDSINNKRLSWLSAAESSGSSGVCDLGSLPEDGYGLSPRSTEDSRFFPRGSDPDSMYSSLPRRKLSQQINKSQIVVDPNSNVSLRRNITVGGYDGSFIRNNIYRKTYTDTTATTSTPIRPPRKKPSRRRAGASTGRYSTQPIVLPSNMNTSDVLPRHPMKTVELRPLSPDRLFYSSESEKSISISRSVTENHLQSASESKIRTSSSKSEPNDMKRLSNSIKEHHVTVRRHSRSFDENYSTLPKDLVKRRSSFAKAMNSSETRNFSVDERDQRISRQLSASRTAKTTYTTTKESTRSSSVDVSSTLSPNSERKNVFFNLKAKLSKSLSEI